MQDPTPIIKDLVDQLEHADDLINELMRPSAVELLNQTSEQIDRRNAITRAHRYLTTIHNADLFEQEASA